MGGLLLLLALCLAMVSASFLAGSVPLSITLSQSQLRLISSIGIGILVGTSMIIIIPEGLEAVVTASRELQSVKAQRRLGLTSSAVVLEPYLLKPPRSVHLAEDNPDMFQTPTSDMSQSIPDSSQYRKGSDGVKAIHIRAAAPARVDDHQAVSASASKDNQGHEDEGIPTAYIGFALISGFLLMFCVDRVPQHASDQLHPMPATRHVSLQNLSSNLDGDDDDLERSSFLGGFATTTMTSRQSRSLATTMGLVIHSVAEGIALGASATAQDMKLGFIIFFAIMVHKAPSAFGLTSVLLRQGLSTRAARGHLVVFSMAAPIGAVLTFLAISILGGRSDGYSGDWWTGMLLLFSGGTFLYVATHAMHQDHDEGLVGDENGGFGDQEGTLSQGRSRTVSKPQMRDTLLIAAGMLLPMLTQFGHHH